MKISHFLFLGLLQLLSSPTSRWMTLCEVVLTSEVNVTTTSRVGKVKTIRSLGGVVQHNHSKAGVKRPYRVSILFSIDRRLFVF